MQKDKAILSGIKYVYLVIFFALLSGLFFPIIENGAKANEVIVGTLILFVGLAGALLVYKAATSEKRQKIYLGAGFAILAVALLLIFSAAGRLG